jgi:hypothetical protein
VYSFPIKNLIHSGVIIVKMKFHLYRVSASIVPTSPPSSHPISMDEHNTNLTYDPSNPLPIVTSTIYAIPRKTFRIKCRREDTSDVDISDLSFEIFLDGVWIGGTALKSNDHKSSPQARLIVSLVE